MKRRFTILTAALALLVSLAIPMGMWGQTTVASFSRSGTTNSTTGGTFSTTFSAKTGYYQDNNGDCYMQILNNSAYWTTIPSSISFAAKIGGGSGNTDLTDPVYVSLLDANGNVISGTQAIVTSKITTAGGDDYTITIPATNNVSGVKLSHNKQSGFNVRYYSFSLSYVAGGGTPTTYTVTYDANGGTGTMTDSNSPYEENATVTLLSNSFTAPEGKIWDSWLVKDASNNTLTVTNNQFTMPASNVTVSAQWTDNTTPTPGGETLVFDFEDDGAHRPSNQTNSFTGTNEYEENEVDITLTYADATTTGNPLAGSAHVIGRVGKNTTNSPVVLIGPIDIANWTVTKIEYLTKGVNSMYQKFETSFDNSTWTEQISTFQLNSSITTKTVNNLSITGDQLYLRWTVTVQSSTTGNRDFNLDNVVITYSANSNPVPSFTITNNNELAYDANSGSFNFTVNNPVEGGTTSIAEDVDWISEAAISGNSVTFTTTTNEAFTPREGVITLTYTYGDNDPVTKDVTVTQAAAPVIYTTIPDLFAAATSTQTNVLVTFDSWVVSGTSDKNVFVTDNQGNGFIIFDNNGGLAQVYPAGSILSGTAVSCALKKYNGAAELVNVNATDLTITAGGTVSTANIAMANLAGVNTGALVHYDNLICSIDNNKYYLSDGTTTIQVYNTLYSFTELEDGKTYNITGIYQQFNSTKEILPRSAADIEEVVVTTPSITVTPDEVNVDAEEYNGTLDLTYENLSITEMSDFDIQFYDANGDELSEEPDWIEVLVAEQDSNVGDGYVVSYTVEENEGATRTAYFKVYAMDEETNFVYSNLVTISQAAPVAPVTGDKYVKVTSTDDLTSGQYLIVYEVGSVAFDGSLTTLDVASNTIGIVISNYEIAVNATTAASEFTIDVTAGTIKSTSGYYIGRTTDANGMLTSTGTAYTNTISIDESGNAVVLASGGAYLRYNATSGQDRFRYFKSSTYTDQKAIQLYKKVSEPVTKTLHITGYTNNGGYYLIASPIGTVAPTQVTNMITDDDDNNNRTYDLYRFDQAEELEWQNYRYNNFANAFDLTVGHGYLYGNLNEVELVFTGTAITSGTQNVTLDYTEGAEFAGWNLVGNPFGVEAYIDRPFYRMNTSGTEINSESEEGSIGVMEGVFVIANSNNKSMEFSTESKGKKGSTLALNLSSSHTVLDRAIVRFDEGQQLPKFQLNKNHTKVYFTMDGKDYAIVRSEEIGELPVNFKAEDNGTYSMNFSCENVGFAYLHLIDNKTGNDVDLLKTPSYSFEAKTTDYESRFKLVFATGDNSNDDTFAFYSNGSFVINNEGNATLQVIDIMGRIVKSESVNGCTNVNVNAAPGVYMLRLVNGDNVKTQKVVVK